MPASDIAKFLSTAFLALIIGGILSLILGGIFSVVDTLMSGLLALLLAVLLIYLYKFTDLDGLRFAEWIVLLLMIGGLGTLITGFVPQVSQFILSSGAFTLTGLGFTILYIFVADAIADKVF